MLFELLYAVYDAAKEGVKTTLSILVGDVIVNIFQQGKKDKLLMSNIEKITQSHRFMDAQL